MRRGCYGTHRHCGSAFQAHAIQAPETLFVLAWVLDLRHFTVAAPCWRIMRPRHARPTVQFGSVRTNTLLLMQSLFSISAACVFDCTRCTIIGLQCIYAHKLTAVYGMNDAPNMIKVELKLSLSFLYSSVSQYNLRGGLFFSFRP